VIDIGSVVNGKYRLVRLLGDGGMGSVYEAQHAVLGTRVAVKVLHPELARRTGLVERFLQEARVAAQIRSPHVVQVADIDRTPEGYAYIVMELLEGEALSSVLDRLRKLPVMMACEYIGQVLEALEAAHALGVIHRDLKPENVFVTFAGGKPVLKLIDFGIAKARRVDPQQKNLTVAGVVMGTAEYMAPEQARSADKVDARADIYAVGVMLYEMIAGARPVTGEDARVIALKVERGEVVPLVQAAPETPREIAGLVHRAMAARPELRFATATDMRLALEAATSGKRPATASMGARVASVGGGKVDATRAPDPDVPVDTLRASPVATALAPPSPIYAGAAWPVGAASAVAVSPSPPVRRRRRMPVVALIALSVLVGAGVVGILVGTGTWASSTAPPELATTAQLEPTAKGDAASGPAAASMPAPPTDVPTLLPAKPTAPMPRPSPSGHPPSPAVVDAGFPPFVFPTTLPSTFPPFPSGLPLPLGFPTTLPSGFPSILPAWPQVPLPSPAPTHSASNTPGY
jgi:serine/threonine-protein kinase